MNQVFDIGTKVILKYACNITWCTTCPEPGDIGVIKEYPPTSKGFYKVYFESMQRTYQYQTKHFRVLEENRKYSDGF